jgi:hypothetical protein
MMFLWVCADLFLLLLNSVLRLDTVDFHMLVLSEKVLVLESFL